MDRRAAVLTSLGLVGGAWLPGCANLPRSVAPGAQCYRARNGTGTKVTCTPEAVPDAAADTQAKRFDSTPGLLTIYVVRNRWGDAVNTVHVGVNAGRRVTTIPASLVRFVVPPGEHRVVFDWAKGQGDFHVHGEAGQVLFVELVGSLWIWNEWYRLEVGDPSTRDRARDARLLADLKTD